ncbi:hypothetical protein GCM10022251_64240 [Phytohabitans flavus]|uniref:Uncharacterized protein n=1 Tax=Phytohabitans flavus TaxID=1076124 RepID=A0A6F8XV92_9ACTN|nr:hypothetical protein [Phytohabitans flavus]BCB77707.1 hypothetical protein Pflav_041170 [Phytohabitans flavus]
MRSVRIRLGRASAVLAAAAIAAAVFPGAVAQAADTEYLVNPSFEQPGSNAAQPTGWQAALLDGETSPFRLVTQTFNAAGQFPPPAPVPDGQFALEVFWQVGSNLGQLGVGTRQTVNVPASNDLTFSYDAVQTFYADSRAVSWGGAVAEVEFTAGGQTNKLRYFNMNSRPDYSGLPTDSATTKYIIGEQFSGSGVWLSNSRDLDADIATKFGVSNFTITAVTVGNLQNRIATSPFSNMTSYFDNVHLTKAEVEAPEVPVSVSAQSRCIAGKAYVAVSARNDHNAPVSFEVESAFGAKSFTDVAAGASGYQSFATRQVSVGAGSVTVTATGTVGGQAATTVVTADYPAINCA